MRLLFIFALVGLLSFVSATTPDTPPDGTQNGSPLCMLSDLQFTNGLYLIGGFKSNVFHYQCSCNAFPDGVYTTIAKPHLMDDGSSAEVWLNGVVINNRQTNPPSGISNDGTAPNSPALQSNTLTFQTGTNTIVIGVGCNQRNQPQPCYYEYVITCDKPGNGGFVVGDPQFVGLRGQSYQVHGVSGEVYNIVSDTDLQYNSRFVFLNSGECPTVDGKKQKGCWSHPGSYLGELGLKTRAGDKIHLMTGSAKDGYAAVEVNGKALEIGETVLLAGDMGFVTRNSTHLASVQIGQWDFAFENSDHFVNQRVRVLDARRIRSHGLLGQTWRETTYPNALKYVQGAVDDYVIRDGDIFGDNFMFNMFN